MPEIKELFESFIDECQYSSNLSRETMRGYDASFKLLIKIFPDLILEDITQGKIVEFFKQLQTRERHVGRDTVKIGIKESTIATYRNKLSKFFTWLKRRGYLQDNPFTDLPAPKVRYEDRQFLGVEEIEKILTAITINIDWQSELVKKRNLAMVYLFLYTGLRKGELLNLNVTDINFHDKTLHVRPETSKSRRSRILPINHKAMEALIDYIRERRRLGRQTPYLFVSSGRDDVLSYDGFKHLINQLNKASGVKFHAHQFRHTFAVNILKNGNNLVVIQEALGHTDIRMTAKYLRQLPIEMTRRAVGSLNISEFISSQGWGNASHFS